MKEIIAWLASIEGLAYSIYRGASLLFRQDEAFSAFLAGLAEDELRHLDLMNSAQACWQENALSLPSDVALDQAVARQAKAPFEEALGLIGSRTMTKKEMIDAMVAIEFSELGDMFVYVLDTLMERDATFQRWAAEIQSHHDRIRHFVDALPESLKPAGDVQALPVVWERKYLVVDDDGPVRELLRRYLSRMGSVETAANGREGLAKLGERFFDAVVTDVEMPGMDGIALFRQALVRDPDVKGRFVFCSGHLSLEQETFLLGNGLSCLRKPFRLAEVGEQVQTIVDRAGRHPRAPRPMAQEERRG